MAHGFGYDVLVRHGRLGRKDTVRQHAPEERHPFAIRIVANLAGLNGGTKLVQTTTDELEAYQLIVSTNRLRKIYLGHDVIRVAQFLPADVRNAADQIPGPGRDNTSLPTHVDHQSCRRNAGKDTYHDSTLRKIINRNRKRVTDIQCPVIQRAATAAENGA